MEFIDPSDQKEQYYITIQKIKDLCGGRHYPLLARSIIIIFRYDELNQTSCSGCCIFMGNPKVCLNKLKNIMSVFNQPNRQHENNQSWPPEFPLPLVTSWRSPKVPPLCGSTADSQGGELFMCRLSSQVCPCFASPPPTHPPTPYSPSTAPFNLLERVAPRTMDTLPQCPSARKIFLSKDLLDQNNRDLLFYDKLTNFLVMPKIKSLSWKLIDTDDVSGLLQVVYSSGFMFFLCFENLHRQRCCPGMGSPNLFPIRVSQANDLITA